MHPMETVLGTRTKVRLLHFIITSGPASRNGLATEISGSKHGTYRQIEELIGAGVLTEKGKKVRLDPEFPYLDDLTNLILASDHYMNLIGDVLHRLDILFGNRYYIGGFQAAARTITPIDYVSDTILIQIRDLTERDRTRIKAIENISGIEIIPLNLDRMPLDMTRDRIHGIEVWTATVERGQIETFIHGDCTSYGAHLALLQNMMGGDIDLQRLMEIAKNAGMTGNMAATLLRFSRRTSIQIPEWIEALGRDNEANLHDCDLVLNAVIG
ncbi:MAG: hypothetical protein JXA22_01300 [Candidatus Thermoplasmatota archaeon]|nr:hypothetical protein [Candidatus Thermoplasmatota archaeon]